MFIHHVDTLVMIFYTYYYRATSLMILLFVICDISDPFVEMSKIAIYLKSDFWSSIMFQTFCVVWLTARFIIYPIAVMYPTITTLFTISDEIGSYHFYCAINICFFVLLSLNIHWLKIVLKILSRVLFKNDVVRDDRSDDDSLKTEDHKSD